jgi:HlyD family secretion protein
MSKGKTFLFVAIGALLIAAVVFGVLRLNDPLRDSFSGTIEAEETRISAEVAGQISEISVGEGDHVQEGDLLCHIHSTLLSSQMEQAKAAVSASQAQLSKAKEGATPEDMAIAQANLEYAQAMLAGAETSAGIAQSITDFNPPKLLQLEQAKNRLALAALQYQDAEEQMNAAKELGKTLPLLQAEAQLELARTDLLVAEEGMRAATITPTAPDVLAAMAAKEQARAQWIAAQTQLQMAEAAGTNPELAKARATRDAADAKLASAHTSFDLLETGGNSVQKEQARLQIQLAEIEVREAERTLQMVEAAGGNAYLDQAQAEVDAAQANLAQAQAVCDALLAKGADHHLREAEQAYQSTQKALDLALANYQIAIGQADPIELKYLTAKENLAFAQASLEQVEQIANFRGEEEATLSQAQTLRNSLKAQLTVAEETLQKVQQGARVEDLAVLQSNLEQAQSTLTLAMDLLAKGQVKAPHSGTILEQDINPGELVSQGGMLFSLADLDHLFLYIYLAQDQIGWAQLGQDVTVKVDAYPGRSFSGTVTYISPKAQFTLKNVQTREQRTVLTFAVKIEITDPQHQLRIGIPADVLLTVPSP